MVQQEIWLKVCLAGFICNGIIIFLQFNDPPGDPVTCIFHPVEIAERVMVSHCHKWAANR